MPLDLDRFATLRPKLYHLTAASNARRILSERRLLPAAEILTLLGRKDDIRRRRAEGMWIDGPAGLFHIRDQAPLHRGNIQFEAGWGLEDLVEHLNRHVFFWPGTCVGPISYGARHFLRYSKDDAIVLTFNTRELFRANSEGGRGPFFSKYNSGSPRCTGGRGSPRGPAVFASGAEFPHSASNVVEVTFAGVVDLDGCAISECHVSRFVP